MSYYEILLFLHVAAAIAWLGANTMTIYLVLRAKNVGDPVEFARIGAINAWLAPRLYIPSSLVVLLFGILLVIEGPWGFGDVWVLIGLGGYAASFLTGILFMEPESKRLRTAIAEHGPGSPEGARHAARLIAVSRVELVVLYVVVADMVAKPTTSNGWTLAAFAAAIVAAAAISLWLRRRDARAAPEAAPASDVG